MHKSKLTLSCVAVATAVALGAAPMADASSRVITGEWAENLFAEYIEPNRTVTLTLQKIAPNPYDQVEEGKKPPASVEGVTFEIYRVEGYDVTTSEGFNEAKIVDSESLNENDLILESTGVTDAEGKVVFRDLPVGLYYVKEIKPDNDNVEHNTSEPFLIILPTSNVDGESFNYNESLIIVKGEPSDPPYDPPGDTPPGNTPPEDVPPFEETPGDPPYGEVPPEEIRGSFAETGAASILGLFLAGLALIGGGMLYARRRNKIA